MSAAVGYCFECRSNIRGGSSLHRFTAKHQAAIAEPVARWHSPRRDRRELAERHDSIYGDEPYYVDEPAPEPTWKLCAGIPSLGVDSHFEPLSEFGRNRAYADGYYVRCRAHHREYQASWRARRRAGLVAA